VSNFASAFDSSDYGACYQMMSTSFQKKHEFKSFIEACKSVDKSSYQLIGINKEYVHDSTALVDIQYEVTEERITSVSLSGVKSENVTTIREGQIELTKKDGEWKFEEFPTMIA